MDKQELIDRLNGNYTEQNKKPHQHKVQREGSLQIECVKWFRLQYPAFAPLLFHPKNETDGTRGKKIAINAAAGVVPGVPDLILALPSFVKFAGGKLDFIHGLGIEQKYGYTNQQTAHQKRFQQYWEAASYMYNLCRSFDDFRKVISNYMSYITPDAEDAIHKLHAVDEDTLVNKSIIRRITQKKEK